MSTPLAPRPSGPAAPNATRQLLEELDALMQRMLALPVNELGEDAVTEGHPEPEAETTATATVSSPPASEPAVAPAGGPATAPAPPRMRTEVVGSRLVSPHEASPSLPAPHRQQGPAPWEPLARLNTEPNANEVPLTSFLPHPALQTASRQEAAATVASPGLPPPSRRPFSLAGSSGSTPPPVPNGWLRALLWSNRTFDHCTFWLGRPGRWLQGRAGRIILGWLGLGLLLGAVAWGLANWFDWTW